MKRIILITGGQRSGKSVYAEKLALALSANPIYLATAHVWDEEFSQRVQRHRERRGPQWTNIEEEKYLSRHHVAGRVVVVDCITLWCTNFFFDRHVKDMEQPSVDDALTAIKTEFDKFVDQDATFIFVTNEIGSGGVSDNAVQRRFTDLEGWMNQYVAQRADEVILMVCGICHHVKGQGLPINNRCGNDTTVPSREEIQQKIDNLNKPKGSLGQLETLALQICMVQRTLTPHLSHPCHLLFGADHGIEREQVSVSPREITWQQMINFTKGGGGVNMFCRQHGFKLLLVDVGVDHDLTAYPAIINRKIANGTGNFLYEAAMSQEQADRALAIGAEMVDRCHDEGCNIICMGEMGIANTSPSSIWMHLFGQIPLAECVGAGAGLDHPGIRHKLDVLTRSVEHFHNTYPQGFDTMTAIRYFGGFEMVSAIGAMLRAAELGMLVMVDGFIMTACALAAVRLRPEVKEHMIFGHQGDESGHKKMLQLLDARPLLSLGLRLGEGTGALCAYPIIESAVRMINEMNNFENANITKYF